MTSHRKRQPRQPLVAEPLESRLLFATWTAVEQINHSYGSGKLSGGVDIDVSPVTKLPVVVMHSLAQGSQDYIIQVNKGVRRADGTIDWSGTRNSPIEAEPRGHKDQNPALAIGTNLDGTETLNVVYFEHDGGSTLGASATEDIMLVRSTNGGASWSAPFNVSQQAVGDAPRVSAGSADVAADDKGNVYVVWTSWSGYSSGNNLDVWFRKFNGATQTWEASKKIETNPSSKSDFTQIVWAPGTGRLHVAWGDRALTPPPLSYAMSNDYGGTFTAPQTVFTAPGTFDVRGATVTETADGTVIAAATITDPSNSTNKNTYMAYKLPGSGTWQPAGGDSVSGTSPSASQYVTADRSGRTYFSWIKNPYPGSGYEFNVRYQDGAAATNFDAAPNTQVSSDGWKKDSGHVAVDIRATTPGYVYAAWEGNPGTHQVYASMTKLTAPTATFGAINSGPTPTASAAVTFSDYVANVDATDFQLTRNGANVPLTGVTVWTTDNKTFTLNGLSSATSAPGIYVLSLAAGTNIRDVFFNTATPGANVTWTNSSAPPTIGSLSVSPDPVNAGGTVTLTANDVADANGDAVTVAFYRESNGVAGLQTGIGSGDTFLGSDPTNPYSLDIGSPEEVGAHTYYAQATDSGSAVGVAVSALSNVLPAWLATDSVATWNPSSHVLNVTGPATIIADPGADAPAVTVNGGSAVLTITPSSDSVITLASLVLMNGARVAMTAHVAEPVRALVLGASPSIDASSSLDLADNAMVVKNGSLAATQSALAAGFSGGWQGLGGITSSTAAADATGRTALGYSSNAVLARTTFAGVSGLTPGDVLVKFTYHGDADLSGHVTLDDFTLFLDGYKNAGTTWLQGDFDYGGLVTLDDFTLFLAAYQAQGPQL
jgi:hypothetical protein